jgi:hypothetical protein
MFNHSVMLATITSKVHDFLLIQLNDESRKDVSVHYEIINEDCKIIRKGNFKGTEVQLRVTHLQEGNYNVHLCVDDSEPVDYSFTKLSSNFAAGSLFADYRFSQIA